MDFTALPIEVETPTAHPTTTPTLDRVAARDMAMEDTAAEMKAKRQTQDDREIKKAAERDGGVNADLICPPANSGRSNLPCFTWMGSGHCLWDKACRFAHPDDLRGWCDKEVVCKDHDCRNPRHKNPKSVTCVKPDEDMNTNEYSSVEHSFGNDLESSMAEGDGMGGAKSNRGMKSRAESGTVKEKNQKNGGRTGKRMGRERRKEREGRTAVVKNKGKKETEDDAVWVNEAVHCVGLKASAARG